MSTDNGTRVATVAVMVIVAGVLVIGAALTKLKFDTDEAERRNAETEREVLRLNEEQRAREAAQEAELRERVRALDEAWRAERIAPMPREKPAPGPAVPER